MTRLAVFGASGRTGRLLLDAALMRGIEVRALIRPSSHVDPKPGLLALRGSLEDPVDIATTVSGTDAAYCVFGPAGSSVAPFCARVTAQVVSVMKTRGVRRLVCLTGAMVGDLPSNVSLPMRLLAGLYRRRVPHLAADVAEQERVVMASGLDWTIVKPPRLTDGEASGCVRADPALRVGLMSCISRADLAVFLLGEVEFARHFSERVYVSS